MLWKITLYGNDFQTAIQPPTTFTYQAIDKQTEANRGFGSGVNWPNPSAWGNNGGKQIRNNYYDGTYVYGTQADVMDMNGDGFPERVVRDRTNPHTWWVYPNTGSGFADDRIQWWIPVGAHLITKQDPYLGSIIADVLDMDGDMLPDRVDTPTCSIIHYSDPWSVYFNLEPLQETFDSAQNWTNPGAWQAGEFLYYGCLIRDTNSDTSNTRTFTDVMDMNGDSLTDRLVYHHSDQPPYDIWTVYFNNGSNGFNNVLAPNWPNPSSVNELRVHEIGYGTKWKGQRGRRF